MCKRKSGKVKPLSEFGGIKMLKFRADVTAYLFTKSFKNVVKLIAPLTQADTTLGLYQTGARTILKDGNEYIYLPGTTSVTQYDWVTYRAISAVAPGMSFGSVTRLSATEPGFVAISQGTITSNKFGWFQIGGIGWANAGGLCASGSPVYATGTSGTGTVATVCTASTALWNVLNAFAIGTGYSGGTFKVAMSHPYLNLVAL